MIGWITGKIREVSLESAVCDVSGVGYELHCSTSTLESLELGAPSDFFVHTHVREDALVLFGFTARAEKELFLQLMKVNGIGPKMAIKILSGSSFDHIVTMIEAGDVKGLSGLPKVGKKTAEQIVLSLKGKLVMEPTGTATAGRGVRPVPLDTHQTIASALVHLGFRGVDVDKVVAQFESDVEFEDGVRRGLSQLSSI